MLARFIRTRFAALGAIVLALGVFVAMALVYKHTTHAPRIVEVELAGSRSALHDLIKPGQVDAYRHAVLMDFYFILGYGTALLTACFVGRAIAITAMGRRVATIAMFAAGSAVVLDALENLGLLEAIHGTPTAHADAWALLAQTASFLKWVLVLPTAAVALISVLTVVWRATFGQGFQSVLHQQKAGDTVVGASSGGGKSTQQAAWRANFNLPPGQRQDKQAGGAAMGFCVSGGGIRSASFTLGALSALHDKVAKADYLVSVSGGGYAAGAMQLVLAGATAGPGPSISASADPETVYLPGTPEFDHTRRHSAYIATGAKEWTVAIATLLRGVLVNVLIVGCAVVLAGRLTQYAYSGFPHHLERLTSADQIPRGIWWACGSLAALSLVAWMIAVLLEPWATPVRAALGKLGLGAAALAVVATIFGIALPLAVMALRHLLSHSFPAHPSAGRHLTPLSAHLGISGAITLASAYIGAITAVVKRGVKKEKKLKSLFGTKAVAPAPSASPTLVLTLVVWLVLLLIAITTLYAYAATIALTDNSFFSAWLTAGGLLFFALVDQVRWSLHPFYKKRLASAFAVRRVLAGNSHHAVPYDFGEVTSLSTFGQQPVDPVSNKAVWPQHIMLCSAHASGSDVTPRGRRVVSWTMSSDYVGSPQLGWANTSWLEGQSSDLIQRDLTVEAAVAISGAAIASQMGTQQRAFTPLLALTNVRLGSWLPNPAYLHQQALLTAGGNSAWWVPGVPGRRSLLTLLREIFGSFPADGSLVFVTDGGHYENLGLIELIRHRCKKIYCIDASGDPKELAHTLAEAKTLAYEELGVEIDYVMPERLGAPSGAAPATDALHTLLADRLAGTSVVTGSIEYPDLGVGLPAMTGSFVVGKAVLTPDMPFDVLAHAVQEPTFPHTSTADQWFDYRHFDAYVNLGRWVGAQM